MNWYRKAQSKEVLYHGSDKEFTDFVPSDQSSLRGKGIFLSNSLRYAKVFGKYLYVCEVKLNNPKIYTDSLQYAIDQLKSEQSSSLLYDQLHAQGYDGVIIEKSKVSTGIVREVIVFDPINVRILQSKTSKSQIRIHAQSGEWWIIDQSAHFADAEIGDVNHSGMVIDAILSNYDLDPDRFDLTKETPESLKGRGLTEEEINVVLDKIDPRVYGMKELGWKRVAGRNVQTQTLTEEDLKDIDYGLYDAYEQEVEGDNELEFNIEVMGNNTYYSGVPYSVISTHNPLNLREYGRVYAKKDGWNKIAGKTYRDRQDHVVVYHVSPDRLTYLLPRSKFAQYKGIYVSASYRSIIEDWAGFVRGKKGKGQTYQTIYIHKISCPKEIFDECVRLFRETEASGYRADNILFWGWGFQTFIPEEYLKQLEIISVEKLDESLFQQKYRDLLWQGKERSRKPSWNKTPEEEQEFQEEEIKLREEQKTVSFNLSKWIKTAQIWNVVTDDFDDKLKAVYELEYKRSMLKTMPFAGIPQRKDNILKNIEEKLEEVIDELREILSAVFLDWLNNHALLSADTWANQRVSEFASNLDDVFSNIVSEYARYVLNSYPKTIQEHNKIFVNLISEALNQPENFPSLESLYRDVLYDYKQRLEEELQSDGLKQFNSRWNKKLRTLGQAEDFINNLTTNDVDIEELIYFENTEQFVSMLPNPEETAKEFYKAFVFPHWAEYWISMGIEETRETIENIYGKLTAIDFKDMGNALAVINLAINATHQNGDMLEYVAQRESDMNTDYTKGLMNQLTDGIFIEEWNQELLEIGVQIKKEKKTKKNITPNTKQLTNQQQKMAI